jgi:hypothetical protein
MSKFLKQTGLFFLSLLLIFLAGWSIPSKWITESLHYSVYDKHKLLEETVDKSSRIIFAGGSNVSFGVYSPAVEDSLGITTVNTAIHAAYGLKYILDDLEPYVKKGDIIVLAPEYAQFQEDSFLGSAALVQGLNVIPQNSKLLDSRQWVLFFKNLPRHALSKIRFYLSSLFGNNASIDAYHRSAFNAYGDVEGHWSYQIGLSKSPDVLVGQYNPEVIAYIERFDALVKKRGAQLLVAFPTFNQSSFLHNAKVIEHLYQEFQQSDIEVLGTPERYSFPDRFYYDSAYHLNRDGQFKRTNLLIEDLKHYLQNATHSR